MCVLGEERKESPISGTFSKHTSNLLFCFYFQKTVARKIIKTQNPGVFVYRLFSFSNFPHLMEKEIKLLFHVTFQSLKNPNIYLLEYCLGKRNTLESEQLCHQPAWQT